MFKKSALTLLVAALLALAGIVAYSALRLHGPDSTLREAQARIERGALAEAVNLLTLSEVSVRNDPDRLEQLQRLRYAANSQLGNATAALLDLDELLLRHRSDIDLRLDRIRLLALAEDGDAARAAAHQFLVENPGHSRGLELAGETCQKLYQPRLLELQTWFERDLGAAQRPAAREALRAYVYRPPADPEVDAAAARLRALYATEASRMAVWPIRWAALQALRTAVQEALQYFQRSLEAGGKPVAAFRAVAYALEQAQRRDDLLFACEVQRRQFDHDYVAEAGAVAAWTLLRAGLPAAAAATTARWLPPGAVAKALAAGSASPATSQLLLAQTHAGWQMRDGALLQRTWQDASLLGKANQAAPMLLPLVSTLLQITTKGQHIDNTLRWAFTVATKEPVGAGQIDPLPILAQLRLERLPVGPTGEAERSEVLRLWSAARPDSVEPHLALAAQMSARGDTAAALRALGEARTLDASDDRVFPLVLAESRTHYRGGPHDGTALLAQCLKRRKVEPEVPDPIGYLLCAEAAVAAKAWPVALGASAAAIRELPRETEPRLLEVQALLGDGRTADAVRQVERLLQQDRVDLRTLQLAHATYRAAGKPLAPLLGRMLTVAAPDFALQQDLLETLRDSPPARAAAFVLPAAEAGPVPLQALSARYLAGAGKTARAEAMLDAALAAAEAPTAASRSDLVGAIAATATAAAAAERDDATLASAVQRRLAALDDLSPADGRTLVAAARAIAATHPRSAFPLHDAGLAVLAPADRTGADYALAGRSSAASQHWRAAEDHWTAALAFADGRAAGESLARLLTVQGRLDRARTVYALADAPTDPALAQRLDRLDLAVPLLASELQRDAADLLAHGMMALTGQPSMTDWTVGDAASTTERVELLAALHEDALAPLVLPRLRALLDREPQSRTTRMLLARALAASGDGAGAAALHTALHTAGIGDVVFLREVARAATAPGYVAPPTLVRTILDLATTGGVANSPVTLAYAERELAAAFAAAGQGALAEQVRTTRLRLSPTTAPLTPADLVLLQKLPPAEAVAVLDAALAGPHGTPRARLVDALHRAARQLARSDATAIPRAVENARRDLAVDGARGPIVELLLAFPAADPAARLDDDARRQLLAGYLQLVARGDDDGDELAGLAATMQTLEGTAALTRRVDDLLREHPTALPLWLLRARVLADTPDGPRALADLRAVVAHADAPTIELGWLLLAAQSFQLDPDAIARAAALTPLHGTPDGAYMAGLVALRIGKPDAAELALALAGPQPDGTHLYHRALAALQGAAADGPQRAAALLEQLLRDYPSSSAARNAGTLRNQLAGR